MSDNPNMVVLSVPKHHVDPPRIIFPGDPPFPDGWREGDLVAFRRIRARRLRDLTYWRAEKTGPNGELQLQPTDLTHPDHYQLERWVMRYLMHEPREPTQ